MPDEAGSPPPTPQPPPLPAAPAVRTVFCPRCGMPLDQSHRCGPAALETGHGAGRMGSALGTYFALLVVCLIGLAIGFHLRDSLTPEDVFRLQLWLTLAFAGVSTVVSLLCWKRIIPLLTAPVTRRWWLVAAVMPLLTFTVATACVWVVHAVLMGDRAPEPDAFELLGVSLWAHLALVAVEPALFEELTFRAVVLDGLRGSLSTREAVIVSAVLFTILHFQFFGVVHLMAMGLALGWLRVKTGSLLPGMLVHFGHNALCVVFERAMWN